MTTEDPRPETPAPDDPTVSSVVGSTPEAADAAAETGAAAQEPDPGAAETGAAADATDAAAAETAEGVDSTAAAAAATAAAAVATPPAPPAPPDAPPAPPTGWAPPPPPRPLYPIDVRFDRDQQIGRFWAIPIIGWFARWLVLIPHFILLGLFTIVVFFAIARDLDPGPAHGPVPGLGLFDHRRLLPLVHPRDRLPVPDGRPVPAVLGRRPRTRSRSTSIRDTRLNQLWGIPILGIYVRMPAGDPALHRPVRSSASPST